MSVIRIINAYNTEGEIQQKVLNYAVDTGTQNNYIVNLYPPVTSYEDGLSILMNASSTNSTASVIQVNGLTTVSIKKYGDQELGSGDIKANQVTMLTYANGVFQLQTPASTIVLDAANIIQDADNRFVTDTLITTWNSKQDVLGYTAENVGNRGSASGYAPLDSTGKIPLTYIPPISGAGGTTVYVVSGSVERTALTGLISGDGCWQYGDGNSYIYDGSTWFLTSTPDWANINITWENVTDKPATFTPASHSHLTSEVGLSNVINVQQLPLSYLDIDSSLNSNSDQRVPSQKAVKTYVDANIPSINLTSVNNNILNLAACAQVDMKAPIGSGSYARIYDIFNSTNYYSIGAMDTTNTVLIADLIAGAVSASVQSTTGFSAGQEITVQNISNIERRTLTQVTAPTTLVFSTPITNSYLSTVTKVYRSLVTLDTANQRISFPQLYGSSTDAYVKLSNPIIPQTGATYGIALTSDGGYLTTGNVSGNTSIYIYKLNTEGTQYVYLTAPSNIYKTYDLAFDSTDTYLACAQQYRGIVYKRSGDTFTLLSISGFPAATLGMTSWGGSYVAFVSLDSPYLFLYKRSGDTFTRLYPNILPGAWAESVCFSSEGNYLTVGFRTSPYFYIYKRSGDVFTKLTTSLPSATGTSVAFITPDSTYLFLRGTSSTTTTVYKRDASDNFTLVATLYIRPQKMTFTQDSKYFIVSEISSPYVRIFRIDSGDVFTELASPDILPTGQSYRCTVSADGTYMAAGHENSPYFSTYMKDVGYEDATEIDVRYNIVPISKIKEVLAYVTKTVISGFNLTGHMSFYNSGSNEAYISLPSGSTISGSSQEVTFSGSVAAGTNRGTFKIVANKTAGTTGTYINKLLGILK